MSENKIKVLLWWREDNALPGLLYRLDGPGEAQRFFNNLSETGVCDGKENFELQEMSQADWDSGMAAIGVDAHEHH